MYITRFAPSPTGFLHIGGARVALFNWLHAKRYCGKFLLRIEDTDDSRFKEGAVDAILNGLKWLGIQWDGEVMYQSERYARHKEIAEYLVEVGLAYRCYMNQEEVKNMRIVDPHAKIISPWRNAVCEIYKEENYVIRLKVDKNMFVDKTTTSSSCSVDKGKIILHDMIQGDVTVDIDTIDDMVLLRSDGTPTYMLAVVVDDHDSGVNCIIRGDDHMTNAFRQSLIYIAMKWDIPLHAHVPLIHDADGLKLSKRRGGGTLGFYKDAGYLPEAVCNYLLRMGWGAKRGESDIINIKDAMRDFDITKISKAPAKLDDNKLRSFGQYYISKKSDVDLMNDITSIIEREWNLDLDMRDKIMHGMQYIKVRAHTLIELVNLAKLYIVRSTQCDQEVIRLLADDSMRNALIAVKGVIARYKDALWTHEIIKNIINDVAVMIGIKQNMIMKLLRFVIIGDTTSPGVCEVMEVIGKGGCLERIELFINN